MFKKILITALLLFVPFTLAPSAHAVDAEPSLSEIVCPDGGELVSSSQGGGVCVYPASQETCPAGFTKTDQSSATELICESQQSTLPTLNDLNSSNANEKLRESVSFMISIQGFLNRLIWPVLVMIGGLLDNSLLFGNGMEERIRAVWIPIRNIVNILFVIALVGMALYNVLGLGEESNTFSLKSMLPKIIIGLIAVNFSFAAMKVFLDGINLVTASIFNLPGQVSENLEEVIREDNPAIKRFCLDVSGKKLGEYVNDPRLNAELEEVIRRREAADILGNPSLNSAPTAQLEAAIASAPELVQTTINTNVENRLDGRICDGTKLSNSGKEFLASWNNQNAALALALNMTNMVFYKDIPFNVSNIEQLSINVIFSMILYIIYLVSFLALFIVLLARLVLLWIATAMSPILLLMITVPAVRDKLGLGDASDKIISTAIAPIGISAAMTIGWIMLRALQGVNFDGFGPGDTINLNAIEGLPVVGLSTLQEVVVALGTVAVIWLAVFAAASKSIAEPVVNAIKGGVTTAGKWLTLTPLKHAPLFPVKIGDEPVNASPVQVKEAFRNFQNKIDQNRNKLSGALGLNPSAQTSQLRDANTADEVARIINDNRREFRNPNDKTYKAIQEWNRSNSGLLEDMMRNGDQNISSLGRQLKGALDAGDLEKAKPFIREAEKFANRYNRSSASSNTSAASNTAAATQLSPGSQWGSQTIQAKAEADSEEPQKRADFINTQLAAINTSLSSSKTDTDKYNEIRAAMEQISSESTNVPTEEQVKKGLGNDTNFVQMQKLFNEQGSESLEQYLQNKQ